MKKTSDTKGIKELIREELPKIMQTDEEVTRFVLRISSQYYAGKIETEDRFDRILKEMERDREEQSRKWEEENHKWDENQKVIMRMFDGLEALNKRHFDSIAAIGARWGFRTEASFRNGLASILEKTFKVKVVHFAEFDESGTVFGWPDQVELDLIIQDGVVIICEIKSSMSKSDMYSFQKKVQFYEDRHQTKAHRKIVISPMVDDKAKKVAEDLGIEVRSYADEVFGCG